MIGSRLRLLATRLTEVADTAGAALAAPGGPRADLRLPVDSADDLGRTAAAFNAMLGTLDRERRFRSVVHASSDVIVIIDLAGRISFVSDSVTDLLGRSPGELLGRAPEELVHPDDLAARSATVRVRHSDGTWR